MASELDLFDCSRGMVLISILVECSAIAAV